VRRIGIREGMPAGMVDRREGTDDILVMAFPGGVRLDGVLHPGPVARVWPRRTRHHYGDPRRPWSHSWLHVRSEAFAAALVRDGVPLDRPIAGFPTEPFEHLLRLLHAECAGHPRPDLAIVLDLLQVLVRLLRRGADAGPAERMPAVLGLLCQELHARPGAPWDVARMAGRCGWSASRFAHRFRAALGVPPLEYLIRLRLHRARELLAERDRPVHAIAAEVGYRDLPHFSRLFRRRFGLPPGRLRSRLG
jgi:AraC-like DNA-binding protein